MYIAIVNEKNAGRVTTLNFTSIPMIMSSFLYGPRNKDEVKYYYKLY